MIVALWRAVESAGATPSGNAVIACARRHGLKFNDHEAKSILATFSHRPGRGESVRTPQNERKHTDEPVRTPAAPRLRARNKELQVTKSTASSLRSEAAPNDTPVQQSTLFAPSEPSTPKPERKRSSPTQSSGPLFDLAAAIYDRTLADGLRQPVRAEAAATTRVEEIRADLAAAKKLLSRYELVDIATKLDTLFALTLEKRRKGIPSCRKLLAAWDDADLRIEPEREYAILDDLEPPEDLYPNGIPALGAAR